MRLSEFFTGVLIVAVFLFASANIYGSSELAYYVLSGEKNVKPGIEASENLTVEQNASGTIEFHIEDAEKASYILSENTSQGFSTVSPEYKVSPTPRSVLQSLPPYWRWGKILSEISVKLEFNTTGMDEGVYIYGVEAWNNGKYRNETFELVVN